MNNWKKYTLAAVIVTGAGFAYVGNSPRNSPADLRDAVADNGGFDIAIPVMEKDNGNIPVPAAVPAKARVSGRAKGVYGADDRLEYFAASKDMQVIADSVVSLWQSSRVYWWFKSFNLSQPGSLDLCPGEKFWGQYHGAFCSGSLVGDDLIMTAGHCIKTEEDCKDTRFVFGYAITEEGDNSPTDVPRGEVYGCAAIVKRLYDPPKIPRSAATPAGEWLPEFALIRLDRKVTGHKPLAINMGADLKAGDGVFMIGHPSGLPLKISGGGTVRDFSNEGYFVTDLDAFRGNSGSAVFNAETKLIEGIMVRGFDEDYIRTPEGCYKAAAYPQTGGNGHHVTKISAIKDFIPALP